MKYLSISVFILFVSCYKEVEPDCTLVKTCWYSQVESVECDLNGDGIFDYTEYITDTTFTSVNECDADEWLYQTQDAINTGNQFNVNNPSKCGCY